MTQPTLSSNLSVAPWGRSHPPRTFPCYINIQPALPIHWPLPVLS